MDNASQSNNAVFRSLSPARWITIEEFAKKIDEDAVDNLKFSFAAPRPAVLAVAAMTERLAGVEAPLEFNHSDDIESAIAWAKTQGLDISVNLKKYSPEISLDSVNEIEVFLSINPKQAEQLLEITAERKAEVMAILAKPPYVASEADKEGINVIVREYFSDKTAKSGESQEGKFFGYIGTEIIMQMMRMRLIADGPIRQHAIDAVMDVKMDKYIAPEHKAALTEAAKPCSDQLKANPQRREHVEAELADKVKEIWQKVIRERIEQVRCEEIKLQ